MANDGQVLIETKLNTEGVSEGIKKLESGFKQMTKDIAKLRDQIEKGLSDIEIDDVGKELSDAVKKGTEDIKTALEGTSDQAEASADKMADAMDEAAEKIADESDTMSDKVKDDLDDIGDKSKTTGEEVEESLTGAFKEIFGANIVSSAVMQGLEKLGTISMDVAQKSVEAAAEIKASNAQFEQTFKGVEATAKKSLENIAKQTGITATRMQDSFTSIFAFSKSAGADTEAALDISSRAMIAAADSAAYYDKSIEEATETLQSFLKGNFANDAALGIAATETTRNAKANEMYAKSFIELSEAQKVDVLLAMVEAGNAASGALGQAAREAGSWTNVVGEATEAWRQLLAVLGEPILDNLAPAVQRVTEMLQRMIEVSASKELRSGLEEIAASFDEANKQFADTSAEIDFSAAKAEFYVEKLEELGKAGLETAESQEQYAAAVEALNELMPGLNLEISEQTGLVNKSKDAILAEVEALKQKAKFQAMQELYSEQYRLQAETMLQIKEAERSLLEIEAERSALTKQLENSMSSLSAQEKAAADAAKLTAQAFDQTGISGAGLEIALSGIKTEQDELRESISALSTEEAALNEEIASAQQQLQEYTAQNEALTETMAELEGQLVDTGEAQEEAAKAAAKASEEAAAAQQELIERFKESKEAARESIDAQIGLFDKLSTTSYTSAKTIISNWESQQEAFTKYAENLQKASDMGLDETLVKQLADGTQESMTYLQILVKGTGTSVEEINAQFQNLSQAKEVAATAMAGIQEEIDVSIEGVGESINTTLTDASAGATEALESTGEQISVRFVEPVKKDIEDLGEAIDNTFENSAETMKQVWSDKGQWFESNVKVPITSALEDIDQKAISIWSNMERSNREAWDKMVRDVKNAIDKMQKEIDRLKAPNLNFSIGTSSEVPYSSAAEWATPVLASGTVIPSMAVSSVSRSAAVATGNEMILEQLQRLAARAESQDNAIEAIVNLSFNGELSSFARILYPEIQVEARRKGGSLAEVYVE